MKRMLFVIYLLVYGFATTAEASPKRILMRRCLNWLQMMFKQRM